MYSINFHEKRIIYCYKHCGYDFEVLEIARSGKQTETYIRLPMLHKYFSDNMTIKEFKEIIIACKSFLDASEV